MSASLGARIAIGTVLSTALVVSIAALAAWFAARRLLYESIDAKLQERAHAFATRGVPVPLLLMQRREGPPPEPASSWTMMQVVNADTGAEVARSSTLSSEISLVAALPPGEPEARPRGVRLADGRAVRVLSTRAIARPPSDRDWTRRWHGDEPAPELSADAQGPLIVAIALDATATEDELRRLGWTLEALSAGAVLLAALVSAVVRRAILRPVARISDGIRAMDPSNLSARIPGERAPRELAAVLHRLNELFDKVEESVQRERGTIANIAHELRTPVAGLMTELEFALVEETAPRAREIHQRCLTTVVQMREMIINLLALARLESGQESWTPQRVDLGALLRECWERVRPESDRRGQRVTWEIPAQAMVSSATEKLRVVLANLLDNAVEHAPDGGAIAITGGIDGERVHLRVGNPMRIAITDAAAAFRPFWRGDPSRTGAHSGLGLALAQRLVRLLGGTITAEIVGGHFAIDLWLPRARDDASDPRLPAASPVA